MADLSLVTAGVCATVGMPADQKTLVASEALEAGTVVRIIQSGTNAGKWTKADATSYENANAYGIVLKTVVAGQPVTAVRKGYIDGFDLSGVNYWAGVYLSDTQGALADTAGTIQKAVAAVVPSNSQRLGAGPDKILLVDFPLRQEAIVDADFDNGSTDDKVAALIAALKKLGLIEGTAY